MRNREDTRERERERERVSYVNKKVLFCLELCYSTILKVELYCSTILKLIIFVYSPFSDSLSLSVSLLIPLSTTMSLSHGGLF